MTIPETTLTIPNTLIMLMGLPRSGKSTRARAMGYPIVCPDAIRLALHGQVFIGLAEPFVWAIAKVMVRALFLAGHEKVILDATNITRKRRDEWKSKSWVREFHISGVEAEVCVARAITDNRQDLIPVINRMAKEWEPLADDENDEGE